MTFEEYEKQFLNAFSSSSFPETEDERDAYRKKCLSYASNLLDNDLPIIYNPDHLSKLLGIRLKFLYSVANSPYSFYRKFQIPKKNGDMRDIAEPLPDLKYIQRWILDNIFSKGKDKSMRQIIPI